LEEWFSEYQTVDGDFFNKSFPTVLKVITSDKIDDAYVAEQIASASTMLDIEEGVCSHCRRLFDSWPYTGLEAWSHAVGSERSTPQLEAGSRLGCQFCSLFMTQLRSRNALNLFRQIERRIARLGRHDTASISIANWASDQSQLLWLNLPGKTTKYYCWGTNDFLKLSTTNIDAFCESIPWEQLPRTFREAIGFARELKLLYIWIDALCIIQDLDDNGDWLRESGLMRSIYGGSYVNIAASTAESVDGSLFCMPPTYCHGAVARVRWTDRDRVQNFHDSRVYEKSVSDTHLASRAWTLQERLLAPRTISLGDAGMFWECRCDTASEFLPCGFPGKLGRQLSRLPHESWNWSEIVDAYSGAVLTYSSDKLPALSGIARRQQEVINDGYLAGMWRTRLVKQLGWMHSSEPRPRPVWRSPTWSWASVDGLSQYWFYWDADDLCKTEYIEILEVSTCSTGPDPFGAVVSASLRIACTALLRGSFQSGHESGRACITIENSARVFTVVMDTDEWKLLGRDEAIYLLPLFEGESGYSQSKDDDQSDGSTERETEDELMIRGLLLQRVSDAEGRFKRIGAFDF
ncbi:HET-domain-containing protein, partial [Polychaeton citri CBS 116435]